MSEAAVEGAIAACTTLTPQECRHFLENGCEFCSRSLARLRCGSPPLLSGSPPLLCCPASCRARQLGSCALLSQQKRSF